MTAETDTSNTGESLPEQPNMNRRVFMKTVGVTAGAAAVGYGSHRAGLSPIEQAEAAPVILGPATYFAAGAVASGLAGYLLDGTGVTEEDIQSARADELHDRIFADAIELERSQEQHVRGMTNNVAFLTEFVRQNVARTIEESVALGLSKSETISEAKDAVDDTVAEFQKEHLADWNFKIAQAGRRYNSVDNMSGISDSDLFSSVTHEGTEEDGSFLGGFSVGSYAADGDNTIDIELVDGSLYSTYGDANDGSSGGFFHALGELNFTGSDGDEGLYETPMEDDYATAVEVVERDGSERHRIIDTKAYWDVLDDLRDLADDERNHADDMVEMFYDPLNDGDISLNTVAANALREIAEDPDDYGQAAGLYRSVNMPEAEERAVIEMNGIRMEGIMFRNIANPIDAGQLVHTDDLLGEVSIAAEILEIDPTIGSDPDPMTLYVDVLDGTESEPSDHPIENATVTAEMEDDFVVEELELEDTSNDLGRAVLTVDGQFELLNLTVEFEGDEYEETIELAPIDGEQYASLEFEPGEGEHTTKQPFLSTDVEEGDIIQGELEGPFTITQTETGGSTLSFEDTDLIDVNEDSQEETIEKLQDAAAREQESQEGVDDLIADGFGGGGGLPSFGGGDIFGLSYLQAIVVGILAVVGINLVTE